jgi:NAD(P)H-hydrate epimerase
MNSVDERWVLKAVDQRTLDEGAVASGIPQDALMESAGTNAAAWIERRLRPRRPVILAGPGGNGGDALVVARRLFEAGADVHAFSLVPIERCAEATRRMAERFEAVDGAIHSAGDGALAEALDRADCIVDGLFGSGLGRPLEGEALRVAERLNACDARTVSLDLPSGLASDRGESIGPSVRADVTLAMAFLKPAHLLWPAAGLCGNTTVVDVAYPATVVRTAEPWARVCESRGIAHRLPTRRPDGHKGTFGRVLVIAGSVGMTGAAILCCRAAARAGAGLVHLAIPASLDPIVEVALPETITIPVPEEGGRIASLDDDRLIDAVERADVVAVGPGLSRSDGTLNAVRTLLERYEGPIVLDADGLGAIEGRPDVLDRLAERAVLTPHPGELGALVGAAAAEIDSERKERAASFASEHRVVLVLKGRPTAIGLPGGDVYLNPTGNEGLATGGSGDVLTGLIAGFVAGGASLADASLAGAYVHGLAAESYAHDRSPRAFMPSDLIDLLPRTLWEVERCG